MVSWPTALHFNAAGGLVSAVRVFAATMLAHAKLANNETKACLANIELPIICGSLISFM